MVGEAIYFLALIIKPSLLLSSCVFLQPFHDLLRDKRPYQHSLIKLHGSLVCKTDLSVCLPVSTREQGAEEERRCNGKENVPHSCIYFFTLSNSQGCICELWNAGALPTQHYTEEEGFWFRNVDEGRRDSENTGMGQRNCPCFQRGLSSFSDTSTLPTVPRAPANHQSWKHILVKGAVSEMAGGVYLACQWISPF